jgi:NarL family two-component system response regulator LiaR
MGNINVLLAEDHLVTRQGIRRLIEDEDDLKVVGEAGDGEEAVRLTTELKPDVVVMDVAMPNLNGIDATRQIKLMHPEVAVLILSAYDDDEYVFALLKVGAAGYLLKSVSGDELIRAIRAAYKGEPILCPAIAKKVMNYFHLDGKVHITEATGEYPTNREMAIIKLAAKGMTNREIAEKLHLSIRTVEGHLRIIFNKLGVDSRIEATLYGLRKGWFTLENLN